MNATQQNCESCSMPIETGRYCAHCTDADGNLQPFEERFERMIAWQQRKTPSATRAELEQATLAFMMAWLAALIDSIRPTVRRVTRILATAASRNISATPEITASLI